MILAAGMTYKKSASIDTEIIRKVFLVRNLGFTQPIPNQDY